MVLGGGGGGGMFLGGGGSMLPMLPKLSKLVLTNLDPSCEF